MGPLFRDRQDAGRALAVRLARYLGQPGVLVLALPRGGVPVAYEVAQALRAQLDVFLVRKLGLPGREELAMGAIASGGVRVLNEDVVRDARVAPETIEAVVTRENAELERRERLYRGERPRPEIAGRTVILIDDGLATGASMRAAVAAVRTQKPAAIVVAVPVAPERSVRELRPEVDDVVCVDMPEPFYGVGEWYMDFGQTTDEEVEDLLDGG